MHELQPPSKIKLSYLDDSESIMLERESRCGRIRQTGLGEEYEHLITMPEKKKVTELIVHWCHYNIDTLIGRGCCNVAIML